MDGRVKTLHPKVHGGILARRHRPDDLAALATHGITPIDLVVVNLYPFAQGRGAPGHAVRRPDRGDRHRRSQPRARGGQELSRRARRRRARRLRARARARSARRAARRSRCGSIWRGARSRTRPRTTRRSRRRSARFASTIDTASFTRDAALDATRDCPAIWTPHLEKMRDLRYGENPHQPAAWYRERRARGIRRARSVHQGKELSFTNLLDLDAAARIALEFDEPAAVVIKHTNPCGVATGGIGRGGVRARARGRCALGVRRHRRAQSADRSSRRRAR